MNNNKPKKSQMQPAVNKQLETAVDDSRFQEIEKTVLAW